MRKLAQSADITTADTRFHCSPLLYRRGRPGSCATTSQQAGLVAEFQPVAALSQGTVLP